jgi:hypothetical protein
MGVSGTCSSETVMRATDSSTEQDLEDGCSEAQSAEARDRQRERRRCEARTRPSDAKPLRGRYPLSWELNGQRRPREGVAPRDALTHR